MSAICRCGRPCTDRANFNQQVRPVNDDEKNDLSDPIRLPITDELDLHSFRPNEVKDLVLEYLAECRAREILQVRIVHGKGIGNLRRTVHAILEKHPDVVSFALANEFLGGWGATMVNLRPAATHPR